MSKGKKGQPEQVRVFRKLLQDLAKLRLEDTDAREGVLKETSITKSSLGAMVYRGEGGLDAWLELLTYLYDLKPQQIIALISDLKTHLKKHQKLSAGQLLFYQLCDDLSEDKRHFWAGLINAAEELEPPFSIKRMK